jgi:AcrR family transcriptional regulator
MTYTSKMSVWTPEPPRGLDRTRIVAAATAVADESGAAAITMKAVASRLGCTPMALYRHVRNKDGLIDLMLDHGAAQIPLLEDAWRPALHRLSLATRKMIKRHPWFAELVHTRPPAGPNQMRRVEFMLSTLTTAGATLAEAMTYSAMLDRHVFGSGLQEAVESRAETPENLREAMADMRARAGEFPNLATWLSAPSGPPPDAQFELVLNFLLDGIATRLPRA